MPAFWHLRVFLYSCLWVFSAVMLGLTAWRLWYTTHIPLGDPLNSGVDFYDPIVAELCATSILTLIWASYIIHVITGVYERRIISRFRGELIGLLVLFVLWLVGASIATVRLSRPSYENFHLSLFHLILYRRIGATSGGAGSTVPAASSPRSSPSHGSAGSRCSSSSSRLLCSLRRTMS
ncbi:hypothetical protein OE88DRAFT_284884 [Heliocybe sulcata]|uniref:Uncharacterized protein n=1 Tax=Heliocybe sulcata TaxID=5364 RepID=A0A5C3MZP9_9AGAM|nr:hypothetical protein OE88DRAFT_284884 [Heliocybe sulcata]